MTQQNKPPAMARRALRGDPAELVRSEPLVADLAGPWVFRSRGDAVDLPAWIKASRQEIDHRLVQHGAVLFRGFHVATPDRFELVARAFTGDLLGYVEGSSPRTMLAPNVYTSTEYPPEFPISLHNELSYAHKWPGTLFFFCQTPPVDGGETPIADGRRVLAALPPDLVRRFTEKGVRYLRTMHDGRGPGLSWPTVFETTDRAVVEAYCREGGITFQWLPDGWLRTSQTRPAVIHHPLTAEAVWFNQADQWHPSNLGGELDRAITSVAHQAELPLNAEYGDRTPIDPTDLEIVRAVTRDTAVVFPWEANDVLVIDNTMTMHGRRPYAGPRRVLVSMGDAVRLDGVGRV